MKPKKTCQNCGAPSEEIETRANGEQFAMCSNFECSEYHICENLNIWDAQRPLEERLRAEIESLRAENKRLQGEIDVLDLDVSETGLVISEFENQRDAARAELEAYKARRCENCRWCELYRADTFCMSEKVSMNFITADCCCWAWEAKEEVKE